MALIPFVISASYSIFILKNIIKNRILKLSAFLTIIIIDILILEVVIGTIFFPSGVYRGFEPLGGTIYTASIVAGISIIFPTLSFLVLTIEYFVRKRRS